jgi:DNA-binding transcriptional LysR family regulator
MRLVETTVADQLQGIEAGRYCAGLTLDGCGRRHALEIVALWEDVLAVAVPVRSPLLAYSEIPIMKAAQYPLVLIGAEDHEIVSQQAERLLARPRIKPPSTEWVRSFGLMATLVAAGYGIGFGAMSRIVALQALGIVMRPLDAEPIPVRTHLVLRQEEPSPAVDRFIKRARSASLAR